MDSLGKSPQHFDHSMTKYRTYHRKMWLFVKLTYGNFTFCSNEHQKIVPTTLKCKVCLNLPMYPPIVVTRCCNTLLGCSEYVNKWLSGDDWFDKPCPYCREPRGYAHYYCSKGLMTFWKDKKKNYLTPTPHT